MSIVFRALLVALLYLPALAFADDAGAKIAQQGTSDGVTPCVACHGANGAGMEASGFPRLAGLNADYLARQLRSFRSGSRVNAIMSPIAKPLGDAQIEAVAAYYANLPVPPSADAKSAKPASVPDLARWGDWTGRGLPACRQCHGPDGNGIGAQFPGIAGQHASYIAAQLKAWRAGSRHNDALGLMKSVANKLSDDEIEKLASYYAALPAGTWTPAKNARDLAAALPAAELKVRSGIVADQGSAPAGRTPGKEGYFQSPSRDVIPDGQFGDVIRRGQAIFSNTNRHPSSASYVGNDQTCANCHIDAGRLANSAPLWAAWVSYPAYRKKNKKVNTYIERIQGCFTYSMNAQDSAAKGAPAADSDAIVALTAYTYWLAEKAPTGDTTMPGRGYPKLKPTADGFDPDRGAKVYAANCALCHGHDGDGVAFSDGRTLFPPLWGADSYNWGAGMHKINTAAAFIKHNMPLGLGGSLSDQDAWDVAAFMNSHERPQDPRYAGDLAATTEQHHRSKYDYYGKRKGADGKLLGESPAKR